MPIWPDAARLWRTTLPTGSRLALHIDVGRTRLQIDEMQLSSAVAAPMPTRDQPRRHQVPGGRIMRATSALISGEASWSSSAAASLRRRMILSRLLAASTIAVPVIAAA
jgi:hypothetical protein